MGLALLFGAMIFLMAVGMDVAFSMGLACLTYIVFMGGEGITSIPLNILPQKMVNGVDSFPLLAVPMFMLAGELMNAGNITVRLVAFSQRLVGHITGGLAHVSVVVNMIMAGMSGSNLADVAATGTVLIPAMKKAGYKPEFAAAVIAGAGSIGTIIPPSIPMVLIGSAVGVSIGRLFLGGAIPGMLMGIALMAYIYWKGKRENFPKDQRATCGELAIGTKDATLALVMPAIVMGGILTGVTTPTEAAVVAVLYAAFLGGLVYKEISLKRLYKVVLDASLASGAVMITVSTAIIISWIASAEQLGPKLTQMLMSTGTSPLILLFVINIALLILGCVMEPVPIILVTAPILFPVVTKLGIDPIHFGVLMTYNVTLGLIHPPLGLSLFMASSMARKSPWDVTLVLWPFLLVLIGVLFLISFVPELVLWLPNLVMGAR